LPPVPESFPAPLQKSRDWTELFKSNYAKRTIALWIMWSCSGAISYGLQGWLPTFLSSVYKLSIRDALGYNLVGYVVLLTAIVLCGLFIDRIGRRLNFLLGFAAGTAILIVLWAIAEHSTGPVVWALAMLVATFNGIIQLAFWLYAPEIYPTRMRVLGAGWASACSRVAAMIMPTIVGLIIHAAGLSLVFLVFAGLGFIGFMTALLMAIETKGRPLEEISP
jgi:putative MFS transporter